ncbi:aminotransferase class I/II-fold pyridoxal phosphate-dependent enzyme [Streptomyces tricolor]|nr:aminotransferase class I/II-fold pyridoxal phosphate-dependent enzyme [Streptomyces tricolor]
MRRRDGLRHGAAGHRRTGRGTPQEPPRLPAPGLAGGLGEACADWQRRAYGWDVAPADTTAAARRRPRLPRGRRALLPARLPVIVPVPTFTPFLTVPGLLGRRVIEVGLVRSGSRYVYDLDALDRAYRQGGHLLVLCNPHNPLGRVLDAGELTAISEVVDRHGGRVFSDEVHAPLVYTGHRHVPYASTSSAAAHHTLTAVSASKAWNIAGLKCAQMVLTNDADRAPGRGSAGWPPTARRSWAWWPARRRTGTARPGWTAYAPASTATGVSCATCSAITCPTSATYRPKAPTWAGWTAGGWVCPAPTWRPSSAPRRA